MPVLAEFILWPSSEKINLDCQVEIGRDVVEEEKEEPEEEEEEEGGG